MRFDPLAQSRLRAPRLSPLLRIFPLLLFVSSNITRLTELADADRKRAPHFGMPTRAISLDLSRMSIYEDLRGLTLPTTILRRREFSDPPYRTESENGQGFLVPARHANHVCKVAYRVSRKYHRIVFLYHLVDSFDSFN